MKIIKTIVYLFSELSEAAKQKALENLAYINVEHNWWDSIYEDAETIGLKLEHFELERNKYCTGSIISSHFETATQIKEHHGPDTNTYKFADEFLIEHEALRDLAAKEERNLEDEIFNLEVNFFNGLLACYADMLKEECNERQSKEMIIETIEANEYTFTAEGKMFNSSEAEEPKEFYFLFGGNVCNTYHDENFEEVIRIISEEGAEFAIHKFTEGENPSKLLEAADGWMGIATILKEEYEQLLKLE